jgi:hypothetical protein
MVMIAAYSLIVQIMRLSTGVLGLSSAMLSLPSGITRLSKTLAEAATALPGGICTGAHCRPPTAGALVRRNTRRNTVTPVGHAGSVGSTRIV